MTVFLIYSIALGFYMKKNMSFNQYDYDEDEEDREAPITNFSAIRRLKDTDKNVEAVRNRIKMLKLTEVKHMKKLESEQRKIQRLL